MAHPETRPLRARACPSRDPARGGPGAPRLQRPAGPGARACARAWPLTRRGRGHGGEPCAHSSPRRGEQGEDEDGVKEPIPVALNHPQPAPRSPPSCGRRGGGAAGGKVAGGTTASPPGGARSSPAPAQPVVSPGPPFPVPLALPLRLPVLARAAVMAGVGSLLGAEALPDLPGSASLRPLPLRPGHGGERAGGSAPQLWGFMALLLLEGRSGSGQAGAAQPCRGGAVSRVSGRGRGVAPEVRVGPPHSGRGGTAAVLALGARPGLRARRCV